MKRIFILLPVIFCYSLLKAQHADPVRTELVMHTHGEEIVIDGLASENSWPILSEIDAKYVPVFVSDDQDFSGSMGLCYDYTNLYVFVTVNDDSAVTSCSLSSPWSYDNIEIFLDLDTTFGGNANDTYGEDAIQLRFNRGCTGNTNSTAEINNNADIESFILEAQSNYSLEVAIPWTTILPEGSMPEDIMEWIDKSMGFDIQIADNDGNGRESQFAWDGDLGEEDNAWYDTRTFGLIELMTSNPDMQANAGADQTVYSQETVTLDGTASEVQEEYTLSYNWTAPEGINLDDPTAAQPTFTAPQLPADTTLTFALVVNDGAFDSEPDTVIITVINSALGFNKVEAVSMQIFPNPVSSVLNIKLNDELSLTGCKLSIYNSNGQVIREEEISNREFKIDLSEIPNGIYSVQLRNGLNAKLAYERISILR